VPAAAAGEWRHCVCFDRIIRVMLLALPLGISSVCYLIIRANADSCVVVVAASLVARRCIWLLAAGTWIVSGSCLPGELIGSKGTPLGEN
jgi:hypothetical protein